MEIENKQKRSVREFWQVHSESMKPIAKIDDIYIHYLEFINQNKTHILFSNVPPINKYIFRTMIRKMGYKGGIQPTTHECLMTVCSYEECRMAVK